MHEGDRIKPYTRNPAYWQYRGQPQLLLGGSVEDNLFQIPDLREHLDLLHAAGGNYVRGTMSSRDPGNVWPFGHADDGTRYDLRIWNEEYWRRFATFLELTHQRDIVVQIEVWDRFDFARQPWNENPFNPKLNVNYTAQASGLKETIDTHPGRRENAFFRTVPALENNQIVLRFQHAFVDKMLSYSLRYGHVLYCMDNETNEPPAWGSYWATYIRSRASEAGVRVETTEMWDAHNVLDEVHRATWEHPEVYTFCDISQNNHQPPVEHWHNAQAYRRRVIETGMVRPINSVKVYGCNSYRYGTTRDAIERFWRNMFGGFAAVRFHRPPTGLGLSERAQANIKSARMLSDAIDVFTAEPHNDLLGNRSYNEAYCFATPGVEYAVFFTDGGDVLLDCSAVEDADAVTVRWLDIARSRWLPEGQRVVVSREVRLVTPQDEGYWVALVKPDKEPCR